MAESCCDRVGVDRSPGPGREGAERDRAERDPMHAGRLMAHCPKETTNFPIPALVQIDEEVRLSS